WIEECLRQKHQYLFGGQANGSDEKAARVTVGDYLEKIFQIPIWMSPIGSQQRAAVVKSLLGTTAAPEARGDGTKTVPSGEFEPPPPPPSRGRQADREEADGFQAEVGKAEARPDPLRITREEAQFVDEVAPLLSDKPRALKRFVNTYRLLKASLPDVDRQ